MKVSWYSRAKEEADKGIPRQDRVTSVGVFVTTLLILVYFVLHHVGQTGFFTLKFETLEMILFYGSLIFLIISSGLEGIFAQRLLSRLWDALGGLIFATIGVSWLLIVFPFDFTYFSNILPDFLRFVVQWISNDIAKGIMVIGIILLVVAVIYSPMAYKIVEIKRFNSNDND